MKPEPTKKTPKPVRCEIVWKDTDCDDRLRKWGEFGEYFTAQIEVNPRTGKGTIKLIKP